VTQALPYKNKRRSPAPRDPHGNYRFLIELDGLQVAGFSEVTGLEVETELEEYAEGGQNQFIHRFPKRTKYPNLVFKRGFAYTNELWDWYEFVRNGWFQHEDPRPEPVKKPKRTDGTIYLLDAKGGVIGGWHFFNAYPVRWVGPSFNSLSNEVAVESLEVAHSGLSLFL